MEADDQLLLKKRARRRLVGAITLVLGIVLILPMVFDKEPKLLSQDINIQIPSKEEGKFVSKIVPLAPKAEVAIKPDVKTADATGIKPEPVPTPAPPLELKPAPALETQVVSPPAPVAKVEAKPKSEPVSKAESKPLPKSAQSAAAPATNAANEAARAQAALSDGSETFIVQLGVFAKPENAKQVQARVKAAGFKSYTEKIAGEQKIRVRAGPFATKELAERARAKLKTAGLPGVVASR